MSKLERKTRSRRKNIAIELLIAYLVERINSKCYHGEIHKFKTIFFLIDRSNCRRIKDYFHNHIDGLIKIQT